MAKKDKKKSAKQDRSPADSVRAAVEQAVATTTGEITSAAVRVRDAIEDLRVLEDLKGLRAEIDRLERRVAALESSGGPAKRKPAPRRATPARKAPARTSPPRASAGTKPAGTRPAKAPAVAPAGAAAPGRS